MTGTHFYPVFAETFVHNIEDASLASDGGNELYVINAPLFRYGYPLRASRADEAYQQVISLNEYGEMAEAARQARSKIATGTFREAPGDVRMDAVMYLVSALEKFQDKSPDELQKIGFEIAMLGTRGININEPESSYPIDTLPAECSGLSFVCRQCAVFRETMLSDSTERRTL